MGDSNSTWRRRKLQPFENMGQARGHFMGTAAIRRIRLECMVAACGDTQSQEDARCTQFSTRGRACRAKVS